LVACYILATYLLDAFHVAGYLWPNGESGAGKTTLLGVVAQLGYLGQLILAGSSFPTLRDMADYGATLAFDDAEAVMDVRKTDPDKRTLLLAGNRRGATVAVKELVKDCWVTRHVDTYCPRLFSAIRLPDTVLASRSIILPLVRSGDSAKSKRNPMNPEDWPCDRVRLVDECWGLALANLPILPEQDRSAAALARLAGRNLEPWRAVLAVAYWLQERHKVDCLFERMEELSEGYQKERREIEGQDKVRVLYRALLVLAGDGQPSDEIAISPKAVAEEMNNIAADEDLGQEGKDFTNARRVGWLLKGQRFKRGNRPEEGKRWALIRQEIAAGAQAHGLDPTDPQMRKPAPARQSATGDFTSAYSADH
jgi:hypothetical protein